MRLSKLATWNVWNGPSRAPDLSLFDTLPRLEALNLHVERSSRVAKITVASPSFVDPLFRSGCSLNSSRPTTSRSLFFSTHCADLGCPETHFNTENLRGDLERLSADSGCRLTLLSISEVDIRSALMGFR